MTPLLIALLPALAVASPPSWYSPRHIEDVEGVSYAAPYEALYPSEMKYLHSLPAGYDSDHLLRGGLHPRHLPWRLVHLVDDVPDIATSTIGLSSPVRQVLPLHSHGVRDWVPEHSIPRISDVNDEPLTHIVDDDPSPLMTKRMRMMPSRSTIANVLNIERLNRPSEYALLSDDIPETDNNWFLRKGFRPRHHPRRPLHLSHVSDIVSSALDLTNTLAQNQQNMRLMYV